MQPATSGNAATNNKGQVNSQTQVGKELLLKVLNEPFTISADGKGNLILTPFKPQENKLQKNKAGES